MRPSALCTGAFSFGDIMEEQVLYLGRWVSREHFKAFVYNSTGQHLAKSYQEYSELISSGLWQAEPQKENNIVDLKPKRGRKCQSQHKA